MPVGFSGKLSSKEPACQCRRHGFNPSFREGPTAMEQLSPCANTANPCSKPRRHSCCSPRAAEPALHSRRSCRARAPQQEKPLQWGVCTSQPESSPCRHN